MSFNGGTFNRFTYNGTAVASIPKTDSESTSAISESEVVGVGREDAAEALWLNPESDGPNWSGTFNGFTFGSMTFNGGTRQPGADWSIRAYVPDAESTPAISESEQVIQYIVLDFASSDPSFVRYGSLVMTWELNKRARCSFGVNYPGDATSNYVPRCGHRVLIKDGSTKLFAGSIEQSLRWLQRQPNGTMKAELDVESVGWEQIADRFLFTGTYTDQDLDVIVSAIVTEKLAGEGVTCAGLPTGVTIAGTIVFSYERVSDCFNQLAKLSGYWWRIDADKVVRFYSSGTAASSPLATITATSGNYRSIKVSESRDNYRNRQYLTDVITPTGAQTESFVGDNETRTFTLAYPLHSEPTASLIDGMTTTPLTVGIRDMDTGKQLYWTKGSNEVVTDSGLAAVSSTETLEVVYTGEYRQVRAVSDASEIADRVTVEGGTGVYEAVSADGLILESAAAADAYAQALLGRYAPIPSVVTIETDEGGVFPGMSIAIAMPELGLSGDFFVSKVTARNLNKKDLRYSIECSSTEPEESWKASLQRAKSTKNLTQLPYTDTSI